MNMHTHTHTQIQITLPLHCTEFPGNGTYFLKGYAAHLIRKKNCWEDSSFPGSDANGVDAAG